MSFDWPKIQSNIYCIARGPHSDASSSFRHCEESSTKQSGLWTRLIFPGRSGWHGQVLLPVSSPNVGPPPPADSFNVAQSSGLSHKRDACATKTRAIGIAHATLKEEPDRQGPHLSSFHLNHRERRLRQVDRKRSAVNIVNLAGDNVRCPAEVERRLNPDIQVRQRCFDRGQR